MRGGLLKSQNLKQLSPAEKLLNSKMQLIVNQMDNRALTQADVFRKIHRDLIFERQKNPNFKPKKGFRVFDALADFQNMDNLESYKALVNLALVNENIRRKMTEQEVIQLKSMA